MMATVPHVTSGLGLRKFQADGFLLTRVYRVTISVGFSGSVVPSKYQAITAFRVFSSVHQTMLVTVVPSRYISTEKATIKLSLGLMSKIL